MESSIESFRAFGHVIMQGSGPGPSIAQNPHSLPPPLLPWQQNLFVISLFGLFLNHTQHHSVLALCSEITSKRIRVPLLSLGLDITSVRMLCQRSNPGVSHMQGKHFIAVQQHQPHKVHHLIFISLPSLKVSNSSELLSSIFALQYK